MLVYEFDCSLRVAADSVEEARYRANEIAFEITEGPEDAQLSIGDEAPTVEDPGGA